jgi:hypothetical protein
MQRVGALLFAREQERARYGDADGDGEPETTTDWNRVHQRITELAAERAKHEREVCRWLLAAERLGVHLRAGYASLAEYSRRTLGLSGRQTEERLRVGRALVDLPRLDAALAAGQCCWTVVRELSRVAVADTEQAWVAWAKDKDARAIERAVSGRVPGDVPEDRADPARVKHRLSFEVRPETMALFRDLQARVQGDLGEKVDDDTLLFELARRALAGPGDDGRASYQVAVMRCDACGLASIDAGGASEPVDASVAEMAECDGQHIGEVVPSLPVNSPQVPSPHVGAPTPVPIHAKSTKRATQSIPPAIRRQVMRRDRRRCAVPGCRNHTYLDVHHCDARSEGGGHDPERLLVLCGSHHRAAHAGALCIEGSASGGFVFRHADGTRYGEPLAPANIDVAQQVYGALTHMGFKPSQARALVDAVNRAGAPADASAFLREALGRV